MTTAVTTKLERRIARLIDPAANRRPLTAMGTVLGATIALALLVPIAALRAEQTIGDPPVVSIPKLTMNPPSQPSVVVPKLVAAPWKAPRVVAQLAQARVAQANPLTQPASTGSLSGVVRDPSGGVVPGAAVRIHGASPAGGGRGGGDAFISIVTDQNGQWSVPSLPAGTYALEVQARGFKAVDKAVAVNQGVNSRIDSNLVLGRASESMTVTAQRLDTSAGLSLPTTSQDLTQPRVGGDVEPAKLIHSVKPAFPQSARDRGIQGAVTVLAIITETGLIRDTPLVISEAPPELVQAALDAIRQWQYLPTRLNGQPVQVITEITVNFQLE